MEIYAKKLLYFHILSFFWFSNMILSDALILPSSKLQIQQIRSHIECLIPTYHILVLILWSKLMKRLALMVGF